MEFIEPSGVAADRYGNFLVGDSKNNKIKVCIIVQHYGIEYLVNVMYKSCRERDLQFPSRFSI